MKWAGHLGLAIQRDAVMENVSSHPGDGRQNLGVRVLQRADSALI